MRVWTGYPDRRLRFEMGRPKPASAFGMTASDPVPDGVWHHLAATWDGREMRLYLNGMLLQAAAYAGPYSPTTAPLKIGYANAGIGSLQMDVEEVAVYRVALPPAEILQHAFLQPQIPAAIQQTLEAGTAAMAAGDWAAAGEAFRKMSELPDAEPAYRAMARIALARTLRNRDQLPAALAQYAAVFDDAQSPQPLREMAARMCIPDERGLPEPLVSKSVYQHLLKLPELSPPEQFRIRLCLAECLLRDGEPAAARQHYEACLETPDLTERDRWDLRLQTRPHVPERARTIRGPEPHTPRSPATLRRRPSTAAKPHCASRTPTAARKTTPRQPPCMPSCRNAPSCRGIFGKRPPNSWPR